MERLSDTVIEIVNELHRERLDYNSEYVPLINALNRLAAYEDTGLDPEDIADFVASYKTMRDNEETRVQLMCGTGVIPPERAAEITKAEAEGRLLVLPCKVGDTVWRIKKGICPEKGTCVSGDVCSEMIMGICPDYSGNPTVERSTFRLCDYNDLGKTVFLYRDEAEKKLKESGE